ncbi:TIGR03571 family LLM class oxidoreductase [Pasteurellaceae bacterium LIM206]|nr:TIGR03571 family LLM class oxidoreductase [Pasteurellaceae bacterium LIM206]
MTNLVLPNHLRNHRGFSRTFVPNRLTLGLIAPFKPYPDTPIPNMEDFAEMARIADRGGVAALWVRDVPFYDPNFGDVGQGYDVAVTLGYLAAITKEIAIGTAGYVSPLRDPIITAKEAASADQLSAGRFILGLSSGDRPVEYPAFDKTFENRGERFRENWDIIRTLTETEFPVKSSRHSGELTGNLDLLPKPFNGRLPMVTIGRSRQNLNWFAHQSDAWIWHGVDPSKAGEIVRKIADLGDDKTWHPFGYANFVELLEDPNAPAELYNNIYLRGGANALVAFWQEQEAQGVAHITVNLKPSRRPALEVMQDFVENVASRFKADSASVHNVATLGRTGEFSDEELSRAGGFGEQFRRSFVDAAKK